MNKKDKEMLVAIYENLMNGIYLIYYSSDDMASYGKVIEDWFERQKMVLEELNKWSYDE